MWLEENKPEKRLSDLDLAQEIMRDQENCIFIVDAPSENNKSKFIEHFAGGKSLIIPANVLKESLLYSKDIRYNFEHLLYFLTQLYKLEVICIEDVDVSFGNHLGSTVELLSNMVSCLQKEYKIILTGVDVKQANKALLKSWHQYRYFKCLV